MVIVEKGLGVTVSIVPPNGERLTLEYLEKLEEVVNSEINPVIYLAIDPGKTNGVCGFDAKFYTMFMLTIKADDMVMFLHQFKHVKKCIYEGYKVFPNKAKQHVYSDLETSRVIGRIESWAELKGIELVKQGSDIKVTGYKWIGKKPLPKTNPMNHAVDAHVHFMYWAIKNSHINAADLVRRKMI